jgi:hypothetical protein
MFWRRTPKVVRIEIYRRDTPRQPKWVEWVSKLWAFFVQLATVVLAAAVVGLTWYVYNQTEQHQTAVIFQTIRAEAVAVEQGNSPLPTYWTVTVSLKNEGQAIATDLRASVRVTEPLGTTGIALRCKDPVLKKDAPSKDAGNTASIVLGKVKGDAYGQRYEIFAKALYPQDVAAVDFGFHITNEEAKRLMRDYSPSVSKVGPD